VASQKAARRTKQEIYAATAPARRLNESPPYASSTTNRACMPYAEEGAAYVPAAPLAFSPPPPRVVREPLPSSTAMPRVSPFQRRRTPVHTVRVRLARRACRRVAESELRVLAPSSRQRLAQGERKTRGCRQQEEGEERTHFAQAHVNARAAAIGRHSGAGVQRSANAEDAALATQSKKRRERCRPLRPFRTETQPSVAHRAVKAQERRRVIDKKAEANAVHAAAMNQFAACQLWCSSAVYGRARQPRAANSARSARVLPVQPRHGMVRDGVKRCTKNPVTNQANRNVAAQPVAR